MTIDTLKLSKRLQAASMPAEQADALADGLADSLRESYVTREFLDARRAEDRAYLDSRLAALRTEIVLWMFGLIGFAVLLNHWWKP